MGFGWPLGFAALATLLVPVLIHLARQRPRRPVLVGSLRHLPDAAAPRRARSQVVEPWLLALRMLILALLALIIAQPFVRASSPAQWLAHAGAGDRWLFDPALLDAGPQMAILWARCFLDQTVLPTCFGRVVRYGEVLPARMRMVFERVPTANPHEVRAHVHYLDDEHRVVLSVEDLQGIASSALNRLAQRPAPDAPLLLGHVEQVSGTHRAH